MTPIDITAIRHIGGGGGGGGAGDANSFMKSGTCLTSVQLPSSGVQT
jgi:hypothetical protein